MSGDVWGSLLLNAGAVSAALLVAGALAWKGLDTWQLRSTTRVAIARDDDYRKLAEQTTVALQTIAAELQRGGNGERRA